MDQVVPASHAEFVSKLNEQFPYIKVWLHYSKDCVYIRDLSISPKLSYDDICRALDDLLTKSLSDFPNYIAQRVFQLHLDTAIKLYSNHTRVLDYLSKLHACGMQFSYTTLYDVYEYTYIVNACVQHGIENPNSCSYLNEGLPLEYQHVYPPLLSLIPYIEDMWNPKYDGHNLADIMNRFDLYISIGCCPSYVYAPLNEKIDDYGQSCNRKARDLVTDMIHLSSGKLTDSPYKLDIVQNANLDCVIMPNDYIWSYKQSVALIRVVMHIYNTYKHMHYHINAAQEWINKHTCK